MVRERVNTNTNVMIVNVKELLVKAKEGGYAVGAFNTVNLETTQGILEAAQEMRSPVVIQVTQKTLDYAGGRAIFHLIKNIAEYYFPHVPVGIHLDHGKSIEVVERAVEIGFTSVMYDGSRREYADNLETTKKLVEFCHARGVVVQAELGNVPYIGEVDSMQSLNWEEYMTDPDQAEKFVRESGLDVLAVAIGNAHGFFPERPTPDYERLEAIAQKVAVPLVMHGASDWDNGRVKEVVARGISCFNVDTRLRLSFINQLAQSFEEGEQTDLRKLLGGAREAVKNAVKEKMTLFGSGGKM
jgi:fructose-bisphosphate aldolase class II